MLQRTFYQNVCLCNEIDVNKIIENYCELFNISFFVNLIFCKERTLAVLNIKYKKNVKKCTKALSFLPFMCYSKDIGYFFGDIFICSTCFYIHVNCNKKSVHCITHAALHNMRRKHIKIKEKYYMLKLEKILINFFVK